MTSIIPRFSLHVIPQIALITAFVIGMASRGSDTAYDYRTTDDFKIPKPGYQFQFPRDHGNHPNFKIEWWYFTGHLYDSNRRRFAFQATFFRTSSRDSNKEVRQFHFAHMAVIDVKTKQHLHQERVNRDGWDAQSDTTKMKMHNGNWSLEMINTDENKETMHLRGSVKAEARFDLQLTPLKKKVFFGKNNVSRKGKAKAAASYYITFPRLQVTGTLDWQGKKKRVTGEAWMDHEISSSQLDDNQRGWDWASIQFNDGRELMAYVLREDDGKPSRYSTLAWIDNDSRVTHAYPPRFTWQKSAHWTSPTTGATYPVRHLLTCVDPASKEQTSIELIPMFNRQEMEGKIGGIDYWEGACDVRNADGKSIGSAFVELTGYNKAITKYLSEQTP